jgi:nucleotide-binding universal stress UspA family protein
VYRQLLVAYDGSEPSDGALDLAVHLSAHLNARLTVAHVVEPLGHEADPRSADPQLARLASDREPYWQDRLDQRAHQIDPNVAVDRRVLLGPAADQLLELADQIGADLLLAGTHGVGHVKQALFGSVSHRLLRYASCDLLFLRRPLSLERSPSVLVGLDGSAAAQRAVTVADELAQALGAPLVLAHIAAMPPFGGSHYLSEQTRAELREQLGRHGHELLERARATVATPADGVLEERREGYVRPELLAACAAHAPVIVVVGTRGTEGFRGLLVGSVTRDLLDYSDNPVLVVRAPSRATEAS